VTDDTTRLVRDIQALAGQPPARKTLPPRDAVATLPAAVGAASPRLAGSATPGNGGIAGPLTEPTATNRVYHTAHTTLTTSDGLFSVRIQHPQTFRLQDGQGRAFDLTLAAP